MESDGKYINEFDFQEKLIEGNKFLKILFLLIILIISLSSFKKNKNNNIQKDDINNDSNILETVLIDELKKARNSFKQYIYEDTIDSSKTLPYNIFIPEIYSKNRKYPLIIFISDSRMVGKEITAPLYQTIGGPIWATENFQKKHKCFVLVPFYNEIIIDDSNEYFKNEYINITMRLISLIKGKYDIDPKRIYITGQSMGAMVTLYLLSNYQNFFAAGLIISGQWKIDELKGLINSTFTYIVSSGDEKAYRGQNEIKQYFDYNNVKYGNINNLNAQENINSLELHIKNIYSLNYIHNFITFAKGTVFSSKNKIENEHLSSFIYSYKIDAIKDWLFSQKIRDYHKSKDGRFILTNFCEKTNDDNLCIKCIEGYYLSGDKLSCTKEINCENGDNIKGLCNWCKEKYYLDMKDRKCKSNLEKEEYKYCKIVSFGICLECDKYYYLDKNNKCSISQNCSESKNTLCVKCLDGFYLGLDHKCTNVKKCIYSNNNECIECKDGYYYERVNKTCKLGKRNFTNCKANNIRKPRKCSVCKDNYYLSQSDYLCYDNTKEGTFYKCQISNFNGNSCQFCVKDYYIGKLDFKCNKVEGCIWSENENKCLECDDYYCLDNKGKCIDNYYINENEKKYFYRCKFLNEKGNGCNKCENDLTPNKEGICFDDIHCAKKENGICKKCQKENPGGYNSYCLNKDFGCIDSFLQNCIRCDDNLNLDVCTKCEEGYKVNKEGKCIEID